MLNNVSAIKNEVSEGVHRLYSTSVDRKNLSQWLELLDTEATAWLDVSATGLFCYYCYLCIYCFFFENMYNCLFC